MIVVADSSPLNYLIQIGRISLLTRLYGKVHIPNVVMAELRHPKAPGKVVEWIASPPQWLHIHPDEDSWSEFSELDEGEARAIQLAESLHARLLLIDESAGARRG
jgi:predicted nucleic acid-binding protein